MLLGALLAGGVPARVRQSVSPTMDLFPFQLTNVPAIVSFELGVFPRKKPTYKSKAHGYSVAWPEEANIE